MVFIKYKPLFNPISHNRGYKSIAHIFTVVFLRLKNRATWVSWQEEFIKLVQIEEEKKEQVKYKCWAGWASEDKMRDELKIKEPIS